MRRIALSLASSLLPVIAAVVFFFGQPASATAENGCPDNLCPGFSGGCVQNLYCVANSPNCDPRYYGTYQTCYFGHWESCTTRCVGP